jgi:hypothetical protein
LNIRFFSAASLMVALAACSGGGSATPPVARSTPAAPSGSATAPEIISFRIPAPASSGASNPSSAVRAKTSLSSRKPLYVSPDTSAFTLSIDGDLVFSGASATTPGSSATTNIPNQTGTASYTITPGGRSPNAYYTVAASLDVVPGQHTIGVALTAVDGFVLSEEQQTYTLNGGSNPAATLYLQGVVDSAFWCDAACDGGAGTPSASGVYTLDVYATDHAGDAIVYQTNGTAPVPLDNGPTNLIEAADSNGSGTVTIANAGPFTTPGNAFAMGSGTQAGYSVALQCQKIGTATVAMQVGPASAGDVSGFNYTAPINTSLDPVDPSTGNPWATPQTSVYTMPNQLVGSVPVTQDFGNELSLSCDANLNLTIV